MTRRSSRLGALVWAALLMQVACTSPVVRGKSATASSFFDGGERGFVIGRVDSTRNETFFKALSETGANLGRIFMPFSKTASGLQFTVSNDDLLMLKRVLDFAHATRIKLVIVGDFVGAEKPEFWTDADLRSSFVESWSFLGKMIGNDPAVAALDLLNEPNPQSSADNLREKQLSWSTLAEQTIAELRREQVILPIVFESVAGAADSGFKGLQPLSDPEVVYSFHYYTPHEITHQRVSASWPTPIPYPAGVEWRLGAWDPELGITEINKQRLEQEMREVIAFQSRYRVPIYVGEFSCVRWAPNLSAQRFIADVLDIFTKYGWSWSYHEFRGWSGWDAEINSADPSATVRSADAPVMKLLSGSLGAVTR